MLGYHFCIIISVNFLDFPPGKTAATVENAERNPAADDVMHSASDRDDGEITSDSGLKDKKLGKRDDGKHKSKKAHKKGRDGSGHRKR